MKTKKIEIACLITFLVCALALSFFAPIFMSTAQTTIGQSISQSSETTSSQSGEEITVQSESDSPFSFTYTAYSRSNEILESEDVTVTDSLNNTITYQTFQWRELQGLNFQFSSNYENTEESYSSIELWVTYVCSEFDEEEVPTLTTETVTSIYQETLIANTIENGQFYYYTDSSTSDTVSTIRGYGFGLYKFELKYNKLVDDEIETISTGEVIYIAVIPDDVYEIVNLIPDNLTFQYTISSSEDLLNQFSFFFLTDIFAYVNPARLKWSAYGTDIDNINYVLTEEMKKDTAYASFEAIYDGLETPTGTEFTFSSNGIEGIWTVTFTLIGDDGEELFSCSVGNLSTIKSESTNYNWLIWLIIILVILLIVIIILIIYFTRKKKQKEEENVW